MKIAKGTSESRVNYVVDYVLGSGLFTSLFISTCMYFRAADMP